MKRTLVLALVVSAAVAGSSLAWYSARQEREYRRLIAVGDRALSSEETSLAVEAFSGAVAIQPHSMLAYLKRGDTYRRRGEHAAALRDLRQALALDATSTKTLELLGDVNVDMGRYDRASEHFRRFISLDDRSPQVLYKLALANYRNRHPSAAIDPLRQALAIEERFAEAHHLLGLCLRHRKQHTEALRALRRAIEINPAFAAARADLADLYRDAGRLREAIDQLEALAALEPSRVARLIEVALAYARLGRMDAAIATLGRAADRHPDDPAVYTAIGRVWLELAELRLDRVALRKALEALQPAASRNGATGQTLALYGRALFLAGHTETAMLTLQEATSALPVEPVAFQWLAAAHHRRGHTEQARLALLDYANIADDASESNAGARVAASLRLQQRLRLTGGRSLPGPSRPLSRFPGS